MEKKTYKVKFFKYEISHGHTEYSVKVVTSTGNETFVIRDRYRSMREYWRNMVSDYGKSVPSTFPPKKWFGNKDPKFIEHRMEELEHFFNTLLEDPKLAASPITQTYFANKKVNHAEGDKPKPKKGSGGTTGGKKPQPGGKDPGENEGKKPPIVNPPLPPVLKVVSHDKKWRQIVDAVTKTYIDISFGEEPSPPEEVKKKSMAYSAAISGSLSTIPFISKVLTLPKGNEKCFNEMNLGLIENERLMSEWLNEKMDALSKIVKNDSHALYPKEPILSGFEMSL